MTNSASAATNTDGKTALGLTLKQILLISGVLTVIGLACWIVQLILGPDVLADTIPWGIYIAAFFLLAGAGSGLILLAAAGEFGFLAALKDLRRSLFMGAVACYVAAGFMILMDLGKPARVINFLISPNFTSPFVWDFLFLVLTVVLALLCVFMKKENKVLAGLTALAALGIVIVEGLIPSVNSGIVWHSSLIPVTFMAEALIAAAAVVLLVKADLSETLRRILAALLALVLIFSFLEIATASYMPASEEAAGMKLLLTGSLAPFYWSWVVLGVVLPILLLVLAAKNTAMVKLAAVLALCGVLLAKINLLVAGQALPFEGGEVGYLPSLVEIGGVLGALGLAVLLFALGKKYLGNSASEGKAAGAETAKATESAAAAE